MYLEIRKGGLLFKIRPKKDLDEERDITSHAFSYLFTECEIQEGVTLRDIFLLLNSNIEMFDGILGNWCKEIVSEGLLSSTPNEDISTSKKEKEIEYLELHWVFDRGDNYFSGQHFPQFHGIGFLLQEDWIGEFGEIYGEKGTRVNYGVDLCSIEDIIDLPLILKDNAVIYEDFRLDRELNGLTYTLGNILHGIIWELSFNGDPDSRRQRLVELNAAVDKIREDASKKDNIDIDIDELK